MQHLHRFRTAVSIAAVLETGPVRRQRRAQRLRERGRDGGCRDGLVERAAIAGRRLRANLERIAATTSYIGEVRGEGLMLGLKCRIPNSEVMAAARAEGILTVAAGDNVLRLLPPLIIDDADVEEGVRRLDAALARLSRRDAAE